MIKKSIIILLLSILLSACIPVAFVAGASAGGVIVNDRRSIKTIVIDRNISNEALKRISADPQLTQQAHISIATFDGIMLLAGQAPTPELRDRVYNLVSTIPNVKRIYNQITIEPPTSKLAQTNDTWLTTKVKTQMLAEKGLASGQIKVVTENGVVYLMGIVSQRQADLAADVARQVAGVQKVVKIFEYE